MIRRLRTLRARIEAADAAVRIPDMLTSYDPSTRTSTTRPLATRSSK